MQPNIFIKVFPSKMSVEKIYIYIFINSKNDNYEFDDLCLTFVLTFILAYL